MYETILEGLNKDGVVFHISLTTADGVKSDIWSDFRLLLDELSKVYDGREFEWFAVHTLEGNGVMHFLVRDCFLHKGWYEEKWSELHGSYMVRKSEVLFREIVAVYLATQRDIVYVDCSEGWL